jgi:sister-chromatid-cohesion protein PDS5
VREATCRLFGRLEYETARHHVARETLLALADRLQDKKIGVRAAAVHSMARLYSLASSEMCVWGSSFTCELAP